MKGPLSRAGLSHVEAAIGRRASALRAGHNLALPLRRDLDRAGDLAPPGTRAHRESTYRPDRYHPPTLTQRWTNNRGPATDYRNWRRRRFDPAVERAGADPTRPYDLRHSYASLMVQAGYSAVELAAELGHSLTLDTYAHLFGEFARGERVNPEAEVAAARKSRGSEEATELLER